MRKNNSIELIRIIAMLGVVLTHVISIGGVLFSTKFFSLNYFFIEFFEIWTRLGVPLFILITGYLMYEKSWKLGRLIDIYLQVGFWAILVFLIFILLIPDKLGIGRIISNFFPLFRGYYWYLISYTGLFIFSPVIKSALSSLGKNQLKYFVLLFIFFSIIPTFTNSDLFILNEGRSTLYMILLYSLGNYLKRIDFSNKIPKKFFFNLLILNIFFGYTGNILIAFLADFFLDKQLFFTTQFFYSYTSPFIIIASVSLFGLIMNMNIKSTKLLYFLSTNSFSVYLIHANPLILDLIIRDRFSFLGEKPLIFILLGPIIFSMIIYFVASILNSFRIILLDEKFVKTEKNISNLITTAVNNLMIKIK